MRLFSLLRDGGNGVQPDLSALPAPGLGGSEMKRMFLVAGLLSKPPVAGITWRQEHKLVGLV